MKTKIILLVIVFCIACQGKSNAQIPQVIALGAGDLVIKDAIDHLQEKANTILNNAGNIGDRLLNNGTAGINLIIGNLREGFRNDLDKEISKLSNTEKNAIEQAYATANAMIAQIESGVQVNLDQVAQEIQNIARILGSDIINIQRIKGTLQKYDSLGSYNMELTGSGFDSAQSNIGTEIHFYVGAHDRGSYTNESFKTTIQDDTYIKL